jgi:hypothetical protein
MLKYHSFRLNERFPVMDRHHFVVGVESLFINTYMNQLRSVLGVLGVSLNQYH